MFTEFAFTIAGCTWKVCCVAAHVCTQSYRHGSVTRPVEASGSCNEGNIMHLFKIQCSSISII